MKKYKALYNEINTQTVYDVAIKTPLDLMPSLSKRFKHNIYLKREDLQPVFSFKNRGAYKKIASLSKETLKNGVIAASAGNHAQGVALAAKKLGISAIIVMPQTTPPIKVNAVKAWDATVILHGDSYDDAFEKAMKIVKTENRTFIHPFDDPLTIAGQGSVGLEILEQAPKKPDIIFVPAGGGGLLAGVLIAVKMTHPEIKIIGVEPENAACVYEAVKAGERVILSDVGIFADGVAVKQVGENTFSIIKDLVDDIILISTDEMCAAIKDIFEDTRILSEPAGALSLAGLKKYISKNPNTNAQTLIAINSGANVNFDRLRHIAERAEIGEDAEALFAVTIPEKPGSFKTFCKLIGKRSITEFNYRYANQKNAQIFVGIKLKDGKEEIKEIINTLKKNNYPTIDLTDNEMAKLHLRHMVGGHSDNIKDEKLYRFRFPEKPGALAKFLDAVGDKFNISLFHYRNHGAAFGRVLAGIQVPQDQEKIVASFIKKLGYSYVDESTNNAYKLFL